MNCQKEHLALSQLVIPNAANHPGGHSVGGTNRPLAEADIPNAAGDVIDGR
jgi:hypothetical protein